MDEKTKFPTENRPAIRTSDGGLNPNQQPRKIMADIITNQKNLLSADVEIKGSIKFLNELTVDGKVEGEINSAGILTVGENSEIKGEIKTKSVTVLAKCMATSPSKTGAN